MDVMDDFSDRAVTSSSDGATELDASFLSFPRSAGLAGPKVKPLFSIPQKRRRSAFYTLIHKKSYLPHTEESIRDGDPPGKHIDSITPFSEYLSPICTIRNLSRAAVYTVSSSGNKNKENSVLALAAGEDEDFFILKEIKKE